MVEPSACVALKAEHWLVVSDVALAGSILEAELVLGDCHHGGLVPAGALGGGRSRTGGVAALCLVDHVALLGHHLAELVLGNSDDRVSTVAGALRVFRRRGVGLFARRISDFGTRAIGGLPAVLVLGDRNKGTSLVPAGAPSCDIVFTTVDLGALCRVDRVALLGHYAAELVLGHSGDRVSTVAGALRVFLRRGVGLFARRISD